MLHRLPVYVVVSLLCIVGLVTPVPAAPVRAQDERLYIELTVDPLDFAFPPEFITALKRALEAEGIRPEFIADYDSAIHPDYWELPSLHIIFVDEGDSTAVYITPYITMKLPPSPILEATFDFNTAARMVHRDPATLDGLVTASVAMAHYALGQCERALPLLASVQTDAAFVPVQPQTIAALKFYRANCALMLGDFDTAISTYENLLAASDSLPDFSTTAINLIWAYLQTGQSATALALMDRLENALDSHSNLFAQVRALNRLAQLYALDFRYDKALALLDKALLLSETEDWYLAVWRAELYVQRGQVYMLIYEWDRALADYNAALEQAPDYADAYFYRGVLYYTRLERESALADFERYLELEPDGKHAAEAAQYRDDIQTELDVLEG